MRPAPCLLYARASSDRQDHAAQLAHVRRCIASCGDTLMGEYVEKESAGKSGRAEWSRMLAALKRRPMRVHAYQLDRLTRNFADQLALADLVRAGVEVHLCRPGRWWTPDTDYDEEFGLDIETALSKRFLANLRAEVMKGMRHKAASGGWPSRAPFGYVNRQQDGRKWIEPDPDRAPLVGLLFRWASEGRTFAEMSRRARDEGFRSRRGDSSVTPTKIARTLRDRVYLGEVTWGLAPGSPGPAGSHAPLVSVEDWTRAHEALGWLRKRAGRKRRGQEPDVWFRGLVACGCGSTLTPDGPKPGRHGKGRYMYARCARRCGEPPVSERALIALFAAKLRELELPDAMRASLRDAINAAGRTAGEARRERESRLLDRRRRTLDALEVLHADRVAGKVRPEVYDRREAKLSAELDACTAGLASLDVASAGNRTLAVKLVDAAINLTAAMLSASKPDTRRQIVVSTLSNPTIRGGALVAGFAQPFAMLAVSSAAALDAHGSEGSETSSGRAPEALRAPLAFLASVAEHAEVVARVA